MSPTRIEIARPDIIKHFEALPKRVLTHSDIKKSLSDNRAFWRLSSKMKTEEFIKFLLDETSFEKAEFKFPSRKEVRYIWGEVPMYELFLSIKPGSYFSHFTAMHIHDLTDQVPQKIYLNFPQSIPPKRDRELSQEKIDLAFRNNVRVSKNFASYRGFDICVISSMGKEKLGVEEMRGEEVETLFITNIARTLIDIAVRPVYSGGIFEVLNAFRRAQGKFSANLLSAMLKKLNYSYPYHQVLGFYLERSGVYKPSVIDLFRKIEKKYDFYLTHGMKEMDYSEEWRLFIPKGF